MPPEWAFYHSVNRETRDVIGHPPIDVRLWDDWLTNNLMEEFSVTKKIQKKGSRFFTTAVSIMAIVTMAGLGPTSSAQAGEAEAKGLLKAMSDYLAAQKTISLAYDANFEVVTKDHQKLLLANSGTIDLSRPDKIRATREAGFANVEMVFDGKTLSMLGKDANLYVQVDAPGTIEHLIDELRDKFQKPLPGADLLLPNVYAALMADVTDVKDLGSGVIGGTECYHLAFRTKEQILLSGRRQHVFLVGRLANSAVSQGRCWEPWILA